VTGLEACLISIVDDDESIRAATKSLLRSLGYQVETFASAESFLDSGALARTECLILDVRMPGMGGLELQRQLNAMESPVPIVFITAHYDEMNQKQASEAGAVDFLRKPFDANTLMAAVQRGLE
jgi:FixJ family two-component response regulator